jgi:hypothetical protein
LTGKIRAGKKKSKRKSAKIFKELIISFFQ